MFKRGDILIDCDDETIRMCVVEPKDEEGIVRCVFEGCSDLTLLSWTYLERYFTLEEPKKRGHRLTKIFGE